MTISRRWILLAIISMAQLICLFIGTILFAHWLNERLTATMRSRVIGENLFNAEHFGKLIESMNLTSAEVGSDDWTRIQDLVEHVPLPNEGFLCITRLDNGGMVCHPQLREFSKLAQTSPGQTDLVVGNFQKPIIEWLSKSQDQRTSGWAMMPDGIHLIGVRAIPDLNINVMALQRESNLRQAVASTLRPARHIGVSVSLIIVGLSTVINVLILRRYDNKLAAINQRLECQVNERTRSLLNTRNAVTFGLAKLAESRDNDTGEHLDRIRNYVTILAEELSQSQAVIDDEFVSTLGIASSLHDVGKVGIPDAILLKPGRLTDEERRVMEMHATIGAECLAAIQDKLGEDDFLEMAQNIASAHHERWDGNGYPNKLKKNSIPLEARIVSVADVYDALRSNRPYKKGFTHEKSREIILEGKGTQFDPAVVEAFLAREDDFLEISAPYESITESPPPIAQISPAAEALTPSPDPAESSDPVEEEAPETLDDATPKGEPEPAIS